MRFLGAKSSPSPEVCRLNLPNFRERDLHGRETELGSEHPVHAALIGIECDDRRRYKFSGNIPRNRERHYRLS